MSINEDRGPEYETRIIFQMYLKFKEGDMEYALRELFNESGLANEPQPALITAFTNVSNMSQMFVVHRQPELSMDSTVRVSLNPLEERRIIGIANGITSMLAALPRLNAQQRANLQEIVIEQDPVTKIRSLAIFMTTTSGLNLTGP